MTLQGDWIGQSGERLQVRGSRFRLRAGATREVDGTLSLRGHLLALHSRRYKHTWIYEFAEHEGRLALRDAQSRLYLYRRLQPGMHGAPQKHSPVNTPWKGEFYTPKYPSSGFMHQ